MSPYGIKGETPAITKKMEDCVGSITGNNKRTGKPYTKGEKIVICKAAIMKGMDSKGEIIFSEESLREFEEVIRRALNPDMGKTGPTEHVNNFGLVDVFSDHIICENHRACYKVPYEKVGDDVKFDWSSIIEVEREVRWVPVNPSAKAAKRPDNVTYGGRTV